MNRSKGKNGRSKPSAALKVLADILPEERREQFNGLVLAFVLTRNLDEAPETDADTLALFNSGRLTYMEVETPEYGLVGVVRVEGEIMGALEGEPTNRDYIFMRPISRYRSQPQPQHE